MSLFRTPQPTPCGTVPHTKDLKVVVSSNDFPESGLKVLQANFTVVQSKYSNFGEEGITENKAELLKIIPEARALVWDSQNPISTELLDKAGSSLKIVSTATPDYDHCNLPELKVRRIRLAYTPHPPNSSVAELAVGLILAVARRFTENLDQVRRGVWDVKFQKFGRHIEGSTVGIICYNGIGKETAERLSGFKVARFIFTGYNETTHDKSVKGLFHTLLTDSDIIVLAVPLTDETHHMINRITLAKTKKEAILVNVGHRDLVDQDALYEALKNGDIYGAGLGVTSPDPLPKDHKLFTLPNLCLYYIHPTTSPVVIPHFGNATTPSRSDIALLAAENVVLRLNNRPLLTPAPVDVLNLTLVD